MQHSTVELNSPGCEAKTENTDGLAEEKDHESWNQFSPATKVETTARKLAFDQKRCLTKRSRLLDSPFPCVSEDDVFHENMDVTTFVSTSLRRKRTETSYESEKVEVPWSRLMSMRWVLTRKP